jgi:signal transduction histidine kinase
MTVPLLIRGSRVGTITFGGRPGVAYSSWHRELAEELAEHLVLAIQHCQAHRQTTDAAASGEQLLFVVAHELRSPLASLRMGVDTLRRSPTDSVRAVRLLEIIGREERRLTGMIADLLDLGRIRSGQLELELGPVDLAEVAREAVTRIDGDIARSGCQVTVQAEGSIVGRWDRRRLEQVVLNLLANAIKFGRGRPVLLYVEGDAGGARLAVVDRGIGMTVEAQQRIFDPFVCTGESRRAGGLGLGLHIVRTIVRSLGGEVRVQSTPEQGATFTVDLPYDRSSA